MLRCPLCANLSHVTLSPRMLRCALCALAFQRDNPLLPPIQTFRSRNTYLFPAWNAWFHRLGAPASWHSIPAGFARQTVRMFAGCNGYRAASITSRLPILPLYADWPWGARIRAELRPWRMAPATQPEDRLTLGIIAAGNAADAVVDLCGQAGTLGRDIIVVLDDAGTAAANALAGRLRASLSPVAGRSIRVLSSPLRNDFAAQRNRIQAASRTEWVLQLDTDETAASGLADALPGLLDDAEALGWQAIGLTRRNLVDGMVSALYPDPQYRLLRQSVRYTRPVHEYPDISSARATYVHLGAGLIHHIPGWRLQQRAARYESILNGAGRPDDTALLRRPLEMEALADA